MLPFCQPDLTSAISYLLTAFAIMGIEPVASDFADGRVNLSLRVNNSGTHLGKRFPSLTLDREWQHGAFC